LRYQLNMAGDWLFAKQVDDKEPQLLNQEIDRRHGISLDEALAMIKDGLTGSASPSPLRSHEPRHARGSSFSNTQLMLSEQSRDCRGIPVGRLYFSTRCFFPSK
jgi:hypothetical protein